MMMANLLPMVPRLALSLADLMAWMLGDQTSLGFRLVVKKDGQTQKDGQRAGFWAYQTRKASLRAGHLGVMNAWTMGSLILRDTGLAEISAIPKQKDAWRAGCWAY